MKNEKKNNAQKILENYFCKDIKFIINDVLFSIFINILTNLLNLLSIMNEVNNLLNKVNNLLLIDFVLHPLVISHFLHSCSDRTRTTLSMTFSWLVDWLVGWFYGMSTLVRLCCTEVSLTIMVSNYIL